MAPPFRERLREIICAGEAQLRFLLVFVVTLVVLGLAAVPFVEPGSVAWHLLVIDLALFAALFLAVVVLLYKCHKWKSNRGGGLDADS